MPETEKTSERQILRVRAVQEMGTDLDQWMQRLELAELAGVGAREGAARHGGGWLAGPVKAVAVGQRWNSMGTGPF